jgi:MoxR-like ATPase
VSKVIEAVREIHVSDAVRRYVIDLAAATRTSADLRLGASPRATLQLVRAARAWAALDDRDYVLPDDIQALAVHVLPHRLLPAVEAQIGRRAMTEIVTDLLARVPVPDPGTGRAAIVTGGRPDPAVGARNRRPVR